MGALKKSPEEVYQEYSEEIDQLAERDDEVGAYFRAFKTVYGDSDGE